MSEAVPEANAKAEPAEEGPTTTTTTTTTTTEAVPPATDAAQSKIKDEENEKDKDDVPQAPPPPSNEKKEEKEGLDDVPKEAGVESSKRDRDEEEPSSEQEAKKVKQDTPDVDIDAIVGSTKAELPPIPPAKEGTTIFNDNDVLSGRGGGTNVHPGNRNFRDLINLHRRAYLKARKNDKPAISRAIVRSVRENNGRFLKKDDKTGLWFEVGDDAAREKTSQALRQRAPEMRKLLFDTEREEARAAAEEQFRQQRMMMGMPPDAQAGGNMPPGVAGMPQGMPGVPPGMNPMAFNPALFMAAGGKPGMGMTAGTPGASNAPANGQTNEAYQQMFAMMGSNNNNMQRFPQSPAPAANGGNSTNV